VSRYLIEKGSIAIDGISLTIAELSGHDFSVAAIPHTLAVTTLGRLKPGAEVTLEVDLIAKYVEKLLGKADHGGLDLTTLKKHGFA
jgi:riboflavin synthase